MAEVEISMQRKSITKIGKNAAMKKTVSKTESEKSSHRITNDIKDASCKKCEKNNVLEKCEAQNQIDWTSRHMASENQKAGSALAEKSIHFKCTAKKPRVRDSTKQKILGRNTSWLYLDESPITTIQQKYPKNGTPGVQKRGGVKFDE